MINGMLNTVWVKSMLKKHGALTLPELRELRAGPAGDGTSKSVSCALNDLLKEGEVVRRADGKWSLATKMGWSGVLAAMSRQPVRGAAQ